MFRKCIHWKLSRVYFIGYLVSLIGGRTKSSAHLCCPSPEEMITPRLDARPESELRRCLGVANKTCRQQELVDLIGI